MWSKHTLFVDILQRRRVLGAKGVEVLSGRDLAVERQHRREVGDGRGCCQERGGGGGGGWWMGAARP